MYDSNSVVASSEVSMDKPLYYYKYLEDTGKVVKKVVTNYEEGTLHTYRQQKYYRFRDASGCMFYAYEKDFDAVKNWRIYSFRDSMEMAKALFLERAKRERAKHLREYKRYDKMWENLSKDE